MQTECQVKFIKFQKEGFSVFETKIDGHTEFVKCFIPRVRVGSTLKIDGEFTNSEKYGRTFIAERVEEVVKTAESVYNILESGMIRGIGPGLALKIIKKFGNSTLEVLDNNIEKLIEVNGISVRALQKISASWREYRKTGGILVKLQDMGIPGPLALRIFQKYGTVTDVVIHSNPYCLTDVWGVPFTLADTIAKTEGIKSDDPKRIEGGIKQVLITATEEGHVYLPFETLKQNTVKLLGIEGDKIREILIDMVLKQGILKTEGSDVYLPQMYTAEVSVAENLRRIIRKPMEMDDTSLEAEIDLDEMQKKAVINMVDNSLSILTGGPGTGKTTIIKEMISLLERNDLSYALAAPTGRAAKRMAEATGRKAKTLHRLLRYRPNSGFSVNKDNPLRYDAVIVDECSMMDVELMEKLLQAVIPGTRLVFVGDVDQLPSVGPGNVLKDLISCNEFPVTVLDTIHRQAAQSMIVTNASLVNKGQGIIKNKGDFFLIETREPEIPDQVLSLVKDRLPSFTGVESSDIQILCPTRRMKDDINALLQEKINDGERINENLKVKDKVMQITNNYDKGVFNGDIGKVTKWDKETGEITVDFYGEEVVYDKTNLDEIESAYAVTVHKSQGSEYPVVIVCLGPSDRGMLQRNLLYTAITRARNLLVIVGSSEAVDTCINNDKRAERFTHLSEHIQKVFSEGGNSDV